MTEPSVPAELVVFFSTMVMVGMIGWLRAALLSAATSFFLGFAFMAAADGPVPDATAQVEPDLRLMPMPQDRAPAGERTPASV